MLFSVAQYINLMWHSVKPCQVIFIVVLYFGYFLAFWASKNSFLNFLELRRIWKIFLPPLGGLKRIPNTILPPGRDIAIHTGCKETHKMSLAYSSQTISNFKIGSEVSKIHNVWKSLCISCPKWNPHAPNEKIWNKNNSTLQSYPFDLSQKRQRGRGVRVLNL